MVLWISMIFCNNFASMITKDGSNMRCVGFYGMQWSFVTTLCSQTKVLDGGTTRCVCVFKVLLNGVSTTFGLPMIENSFKNELATICSTLDNSSFGEHKLCKMIQKIIATCDAMCCSRRQLAPFLERISYGLGLHYHHFDEISILFETTRQYFRPRYVVLAAVGN